MGNEEIIIAGLISHDTDALIALYDKYGSLFYQTISKYIVQSAVIEEILTEVFRESWENPELLKNNRFLSETLLSRCMKKVQGKNLSVS